MLVKLCNGHLEWLLCHKDTWKMSPPARDVAYRCSWGSCPFHSVVGNCPALFFLALDRGWLCSTFKWGGVMLISSRSVVNGFALVGGICSWIVGLRRSVRARCVAGISLVPRVQSVGFDVRCHGHDRCPKRLVQDDVILECSQCGNGTDQRLNIELWNRLILWHDVYATKVSGKVGNVIENSLEERIAMPIYLRHVCVSRVIPMSPLSVIYESDEFHQELT